MVGQQFARRCWGHAARVPIKQRRAEFGFEILKALADGGRSDVLPLGRLCEAAKVIDRKKKSQSGEICPDQFRAMPVPKQLRAAGTVSSGAIFAKRESTVALTLAV